MPAGEQLDTHLVSVASAIRKGAVTPFLGAGVNALAAAGLPLGAGLAHRLYERVEHEPPVARDDLLAVSQYIEVVWGWGRLYEELRDVFAGDYRPNAVHRFLARLPALLPEGTPRQLVVTTNYDDALEQAFREQDEPFDLISYVANPDDEAWGRFRHAGPDGSVRTVRQANLYELPLERRTCILKVHGHVDRDDPERDSYVVAEDHYIDYMTHTDLAEMLPITLNRRLQRSSPLFLGYGLKDWNLRVFFKRVWGESRRRRFARWAVQRGVPPVEERYWQNAGVEIMDLADEGIDLAEYVAELERRLDGLNATP